MAAAWITVTVTVIVAACLILAVVLARAIGLAAYLLQGRSFPDFRERRRTGRGRSEQDLPPPQVPE